LFSNTLPKSKGKGSAAGPLNTVFSWYIKKRLTQIARFKTQPIDVQKETLNLLIEAAKQTEFGKKHHFSSIESYADFKKHIPLQSYESLKPYIDRLKKGEQNLLWNSEVLWFAKSSGTTGQTSKYIPVSKEALENCHYRGGKDLLGMYYEHHPQTKLFKGKHLIIGGSAEINYLNPKSYYGDLSSIIVKNLPWWCEWRRTPSKEIALMSEWEEKLDKMAKTTVKDDVHIIAGVPSWTLVLLNKILKQEKTDNIMDVWPNLELYMYGGVNFGPYANQFKKIIKSSKMNYVQSYNASEGIFGIQDKIAGEDMLLMLDYGIYYEFIPMDLYQQGIKDTITLEDVEVNTNYALVISTNSGLWRYELGDTVVFTSTTPYRIKVSGRTEYFINAFGEELIVDNANGAIEAACQKSDCEIMNFTACPIYMDSNAEGGGHEWLIEFKTPPNNLEEFSLVLDQELKKRNSDYEAKRTGDLSLHLPKITSLKNGTFYEWLKTKDKLGGQNKIPRLKNDRNFAEEILEIQKKIN